MTTTLRVCYGRLVHRPIVALALCLVVATGASACRRRHLGPSAPTSADARWQRRLEGLARRELSCRAVRLIALNASVWQVDGCGHLLEYELLCAGRHCTWHRIEPAAVRAARDFACPLTGLAAAVPSATRRDFSGCGRAASYTLACGATHCEWQSYGASGAPAAGGYAASATVSTGGYGAAPGAVPPPASGPPAGTVGDASLADIVIPPPPGAYAEPPQPIVAVPAPASPPPVPGPTATPPAPPPSTDDVVIPPPPP